MTGPQKHLVFIINPASGTDRVKAVWDAIAAGLDGHRFTYELQTTRHAGHGTALAAAAAAAGAWAVAAVGGDGSVNDVATGLIGTGTHLAIIPKGSGNGLARSLGIPLDVAGAVAVINRGGVRPIDAGFAGDRLFLSNAGAGFDALIAGEFARSTKRGLAVYSALVARHLWGYQCPVWELETDGVRHTEKAFMIAVTNGTEFGYNFRLAPDADPADGKLDLILIRPFPKAMGPVLALRMLTGTLLGSRYVQRYRVASASISHPRLDAMQADGDARACGSRIDFRVAPGALGVIVP